MGKKIPSHCVITYIRVRIPSTRVTRVAGWSRGAGVETRDLLITNPFGGDFASLTLYLSISFGVVHLLTSVERSSAIPLS